MRAAVVGAGAWGRNLVRTLHQLDALHSVTETDPGRREALKAEYAGVTVYGDLGGLLSSDAAAAVVCAPAPTHYEIASQLIQAGMDVLVEKPMTLDVADSERLVALARERDRVLMVGHLLLYQPAVQWMKDALSKGVIGSLRTVHQRRLGLGRARSVENVLWSLGVHDVAVAMYLVRSAPEAVEAIGQRSLQPSIDDDIHLSMRFGEGVVSHLHCSWLWPERERRTVLVGSEAMLAYNELDQTVVLHKKRIDDTLQNVDDGEEVAYKGAGEPLKLQLEHFLECVEKRQKPISDGESGLQVVRVLQTASERLGK